MAFRFIIITSLAALARASIDSNAFSYGINNPNIGNIKIHHERLFGNSVIRQNSLIDFDRAKRIVDYESNPPTGFNALKKDPVDGIQPPSAIANSIDTGAIENSLVKSAEAPLSPLSVPAVPTTPKLVNRLAQVSPIVNIIRQLAGGFAPFASGAPRNLGLATAISYANNNRYPGYAIHGSRYVGDGYFGFGAARFDGALGYDVEAPLAGSALRLGYPDIAFLANPVVSPVAYSVIESLSYPGVA